MPALMRVLFVTYDDDPPIGGQGVVVRGLRNALEKEGVQVVTVSGHGEHAIAVPRVTGRAPLDFSLLLARRPELLNTVDADVVHAQGGPGGVLLVRPVGRPLVYTAHHTYRQAHRLGRPARILAPLEAACYRRAARVAAVSPSTADSVIAMGVRPSRVEVIPPGIEVPDREDSKRDSHLMLFVGRLDPVKRPLDAVAVMREVCDRHPTARGVVVGRGVLAGAVAAACAAVPGGRVAFRGGAPDAAVSALYARAALVLMPSLYEGLGLVALEANAAGAAVAGYAVPGLRDAGRAGAVLVADGDRGALSRAAHDLLSNPRHRDELADAGRQWVLRHYSWDTHGRRMADIYAEVVRAG